MENRQTTLLKFETIIKHLIASEFGSTWKVAGVAEIKFIHIGCDKVNRWYPSVSIYHGEAPESTYDALCARIVQSGTFCGYRVVHINNVRIPREFNNVPSLLRLQICVDPHHQDDKLDSL